MAVPLVSRRRCVHIPDRVSDQRPIASCVVGGCAAGGGVHRTRTAPWVACRAVATDVRCQGSAARGLAAGANTGGAAGGGPLATPECLRTGCGHWLATCPRPGDTRRACRRGAPPGRTRPGPGAREHG